VGKINTEIIEYLLDTGWACAWIKAVDGVVKDAAPIFHTFIGQTIKHFDVCRSSKTGKPYQLTELSRRLLDE